MYWRSVAAPRRGNNCMLLAPAPISSFPDTVLQSGDFLDNCNAVVFIVRRRGDDAVEQGLVEIEYVDRNPLRDVVADTAGMRPRIGRRQHRLDREASGIRFLALLGRFPVCTNLRSAFPGSPRRPPGARWLCSTNEAQSRLTPAASSHRMVRIERIAPSPCPDCFAERLLDRKSRDPRRSTD